MENKIKIEALLYKIAKVRTFSIYAIISIIFSSIIILTLKINIFFMGFFVYLLSLYIVCFFLTNKIIDKYRHNSGEFYMSKEVFASFFQKSYILKTMLLALVPITLWIWSIITFDIFIVSFHISIGTIIFTILTLIYFCFAVKKLIDSFVIIVFMTRVIEYICKEKSAV